MATGYYIEPGYAFSDRQLCTAKDLYDLAHEIKPSDIKLKAIEYGILMFVERDELDILMEFCAQSSSNDLICDFNECGIAQTCTGGGNKRQAMEIVGQAFCALFIDAAFRRGWSVSMQII